MAWPEHPVGRSRSVKRHVGQFATLTPATKLRRLALGVARLAWGPTVAEGEPVVEEGVTPKENMFERIEGKWVAVIGKAGENGAAGAAGAAGAEGLQGQWFWNLDTTKAAEPEAKKMTTDSLVPGTITSLRFNITDGYNANVGAILASLTKGKIISIRSRGTPSKVMIFKATANVVEKSANVYTIEVELLHDGYGTFAEEKPVAVTFT